MKIINNLILTLAFSFFTFSVQAIFYLLHDKFELQVSLENYLLTALILFLMSFIRNAILRYFFMSFILILSLFQMIHLEFYGLPVYPHEIWLLFTQVSEITGTLKEDIYVFLRPFLLIFPSLLVLWLINKKFTHNISYKRFYFLFIVLFLFYPLRTALTGNAWGKIPTVKEFDGTNIYSSLSYFLGKIIPGRIQGIKQPHPKFRVTFEKENEGLENIIFVIGESQSPYQMSLFGYPKETTPFLNSLKEDKRFFHTVGISSGVMTDIALSFLINNTFGLGGFDSVKEGNGCLFKLAKKNGYTTHFISAQSENQLKYIKKYLCPNYIDHYKNFGSISTKTKDENAVDDHELLNQLDLIDLKTNKNFIVLHQRGSHSPYTLRYAKEANIFKPKEKELGKNALIRNYDNSTYYFDLFFKKLFKRNKDTTVIYVSDHGEGLGQNNIWGHGMLNRASTDIPIFIYSSNPSVMDNFKKVPSHPTHFNMTLLISNLLGYRTSIPFEKEVDYTVLGADIEGFAGWANIVKENEDSFTLDVNYY
jgi:glucan phosphoethanolaminetransferase (alkaline phosphatase superfamily)